MSDYDHDRDPYDYDDDERFYEETVYNEEYYIERERELIRQSNLDLELEELEERQIQEMREEVFTRLIAWVAVISGLLSFVSPFICELSVGRYDNGYRRAESSPPIGTVRARCQTDACRIRHVSMRSAGYHGAFTFSGPFINGQADSLACV